MSLTPPTEKASSLRIFFETIEENILEFDSLDPKTADYGIPIVISLIDRLPPSVRLQLQRQHRSDEWTLSEFREALECELIVLEFRDSGTPYSRNELNPRFEADQPQSTINECYSE